MEALSELPRLTELTLVGFDLALSHFIRTRLPLITKLTIAGSKRIEFLEQFCTENDPDNPEVKRLAVQTFRRQLFDQFPYVRQLTLIGDIYQREMASQRLAIEIGRQPGGVQLQMFFRNFTITGKREERGKIAARKSVGSKAPRLQLASKSAKNPPKKQKK